ncbi:MAG: hypothetical protein JXA09_10665 [Anaerolineae bacterium]|nr:hypothetical protein [Anaerolineae bacterium]
MFEGTMHRGLTVIQMHSHPALQGVVLALAAGALLGALVALPYEQVLGLPGAACAILRSAVATAVLSGLCTVRPRDLAFDARALRSEAGAWNLDDPIDVCKGKDVQTWYCTQ